MDVERIIGEIKHLRGHAQVARWGLTGGAFAHHHHGFAATGQANLSVRVGPNVMVEGSEGRRGPHQSKCHSKHTVDRLILSQRDLIS